MMTKKDFVAMARLFAARVAEDREAVAFAAEIYAKHAKLSNPRFDSARFFTACGLNADDLHK